MNGLTGRRNEFAAPIIFSERGNLSHVQQKYPVIFNDINIRSG